MGDLLGLWLFAALFLLIIAALVIRLAVVELSKSNMVVVDDYFDRRLVQKVLSKSEGEKLQIERDIDAGVYDGESS